LLHLGAPFARLFADWPSDARVDSNADAAFIKGFRLCDRTSEHWHRNSESRN
jgi:hypothetical protein